MVFPIVCSIVYKKLFNDLLLSTILKISSLLQLPMTHTEETSLLEESSSDSDHGEGSEGEEGEDEEERGGGKGGKKKRPDRDEELIDL